MLLVIMGETTSEDFLLGAERVGFLLWWAAAMLDREGGV